MGEILCTDAHFWPWAFSEWPCKTYWTKSIRHLCWYRMVQEPQGRWVNAVATYFLVWWLLGSRHLEERAGKLELNSFKQHVCFLGLCFQHACSPGNSSHVLGYNKFLWERKWAVGRRRNRLLVVMNLFTSPGTVLIYKEYFQWWTCLEVPTKPTTFISGEGIVREATVSPSPAGLTQFCFSHGTSGVLLGQTQVWMTATPFFSKLRQNFLIFKKPFKILQTTLIPNLKCNLF